MNLHPLRRELQRLVQAQGKAQLPDRPDPIDWAEEISGFKLDPWQVRVLSSQHKRQLMLCSRQVGKTEIAALRAAFEVLHHAGEVLVVAPTLRQSKNLFNRAERYILEAGAKPIASSRSTLSLASGGTLRALPGDAPDQIRGATARLVILDEAAFTRESVLAVLLPMLATTSGTMVMLSTPSGPTGVFYQAWMEPEGWEKTKGLAADCPRISEEFLAEVKVRLGDAGYRQEYLCEFLQSDTAFFSAHLIEQAFSDIAPTAAPEPVFEVYL